MIYRFITAGILLPHVPFESLPDGTLWSPPRIQVNFDGTELIVLEKNRMLFSRIDIAKVKRKERRCLFVFPLGRGKIPLGGIFENDLISFVS